MKMKPCIRSLSGILAVFLLLAILAGCPNQSLSPDGSGDTEISESDPVSGLPARPATTTSTTSTTTTTTVMMATIPTGPLVSLGGGATANVSSFNGRKIYSIATAMPGSYAQGNSAPRTSYKYTLATKAVTPSMLLSASETETISGMESETEDLTTVAAPTIFGEGQIKSDEMMRSAEEELLKGGARQVDRAERKSIYSAPASIDIGTPWNNVNIVYTGKMINTTCRMISSHAFFFIDNRDITAMEPYLAEYRTAFDSIYAIDRAHFGSENDVDRNGRVIIIFSRELSGGILGYFYSGDKYSRTQVKSSNEGDIFYLTTTLAYQGYIKGTLAHEFQHMIYFDEHYNRKVTSTYSWLNEALSQGAEFYNNELANHNAWMASFLRSGWKGLSLTYWTSNNYGYGAVFMRYLIDRFGDTAVRNMCATSKVGIAAVESATGAAFSTIFADFTRAVVMSGTGDTADPRYNFKTLDLAGIQTSGRKGLLSDSLNTAGQTVKTSIYAYGISFKEWQGTFGTMALSGTSTSGTGFGLSR